MKIVGGRFAVVGGTGFIGSAVANALCEMGAAEVRIVDGVDDESRVTAAVSSGRARIVRADITAPAEIGAALQGVDGVFHLAVLPLNACTDDPRKGLDVNISGTFNVLEAARLGGARRVVFSSASSVYGDTNELMDEQHPLDARTMYGATKVAGEYLLRAFHLMYGLEYTILRYMNVYGPAQGGGLIFSVLNRIRADEPPTIHGDGSQSFDFVHVRDVARANILAMEADIEDGVFNVGGETEVSVRALVELLLELAGSDLEARYEASANVVTSRRVGSIARARALLGYEPSVDLRAGLLEIIKASDKGEQA